MRSAVHIRLLGDFGLVSGDTPVTSVNTARQQSLLAYLVLHRNAPQLRQHVAFVLWPDSTEAQARTNLRREFHYLRHNLPEADTYLCSDATTLQWCAGDGYTLDVAQLEEALAAADRAKLAGDRRAESERLEEAATLYQGDLLPGCYDEWVLPERERLRQVHASTLERVVVLLENFREYATAIRYAQHLLRHDAVNEAAYHWLMRLYALNGDRAGALRVYHTCVTVLQRELGVEPGTATRATYERLLSTDTASQEVTVSPLPLATRLPLIGRQREWNACQAAWRTVATGQAHLLYVAGDTGIGKTRLAEELLHWASQQGIATATTHCYATEERLAYAPVIDWLRSDALRAARTRLEPLWLSELARVLPELLAERPELPSPEALTGNWQRLRLFEALARTVLAVRQPLLLMIDDLQWCDAETLAWLRYLLHYDRAAPLLIIATVRAEEVGADHPLRTWLTELRRVGQVTEIGLGPLDGAETGALAAQVAGRELDGARASYLFQETEGNPLFVVETLRAELGGSGEVAHSVTAPGTSGTSSSASSLPPRVRAVIADRLAQLPGPARELASLAATIGRAFTFDVLAGASDSDESTLALGLDELWRRHIVREQGTDAYDFSHEKIREVAYGTVSAAHRRLLHRRVAQAMERIHGSEDSDLDQVSGHIAAHYEQAGLCKPAIEYYRRAAEAAQRVYANEEASSLLNRALSLLDSVPQSAERDSCELALQTALGISLVATMGYGAKEVIGVLRRARELCHVLGRAPSAPILRALAAAHMPRAEFEEAHALGDELLALAEQEQDPLLLVEAHYILGVTLFWQGAFVTSRGHLEQAIALYAPEHSHLHIAMYSQDPQVICLSRLAWEQWCLGYPDQAVRTCEEALALARKLAHPLSMVHALTVEALILSCLRVPGQALARAEALLAFCRENRMAFWPHLAAALLGWARAAHGETEAGLAQMAAAMSALLEIGAPVVRPYYLALLAERYAECGQVEEGLAAIAEGLATAERTGERWCAAELLRIQGELLLRREAETEAEVLFEHAAATARDQAAKSLELRATLSLARLWQRQGRHPAAHQRLASIYDWFTEGFDTPDLVEARALLG